MTGALYFAAALALLVGAAHSVLGERDILIRLFRRGELPKLLGGTAFTQATIRFAWHLTSVAWWGFAALLWLLARERLTAQTTAAALCVTFAVSAAMVLLMSRGRHLAWIIFTAIALIAGYAAQV